MTANLVAYWNQKEQARHNASTEALEFQKQEETRRHNVASEQIGRSQIALGYAQLAETTRHNQASEALGVNQLSETMRHNQMQEIVARDTTTETHRHNTEMETLESREVFTKQRRQDLEEQKFELQKTQTVINTYMGGAQWLTNAAKTIADIAKMFTGSK